jgi:hypothetical protein
MNKKGSVTLGGLMVVYFIVAILACIGWVNNIVKLCHCDFEPSYRAETIRVIGVVVGPVGCITGYMDIEDNKL